MSVQIEEIELAEKLQKECHEFIEGIMTRTGAKDNLVAHTDATFTWMFVKLAELQLKITAIEIAMNRNFIL